MGEIWADENQTTTDALFEARDRIEELRGVVLGQGSRLIRLAVENASLQADAEGAMARKHERLMDAVCAVEHFAFSCERRGSTPLLSILLPLLRAAIEYGDGGQLSCPLAWAMRDAHRDAATWGTGGRDA